MALARTGISLLWLASILFFPSAATGQTNVTSSPHYVFAHYMVCFATYGATIDGYKREIQEAQAAGIDGFALNVGAWDTNQTYYQARVELIYQAAEQLGTGFKLFFSVDFFGTTNITAMIRTYVDRSPTFRFQNKTVVSSYGENDIPSQGRPGVDWTNTVIGELQKEGHPIFFIPHFWPDPVQELGNYSDAQSILQKYGGLLDGLFLFGAAGLPYQLAQCNSNYNAAVHAAGKVFMASITPHYWGCLQPSIGRRYFEFDGGEGIALQWNSIIANQPDWVEIVTWNDWNESTYISPVSDPGLYFSGGLSPTRYCHMGYLELSKRFISLYKLGTNAPMDTDAIFYFYRSHPKNAVASNTNDIPIYNFIGNVQDTLYATVYLTAPANLEIASGGNLTTNTLNTGLQSIRTPFAPGKQTLTLRRAGQPVIFVQGPNILQQIQLYDFFPASGYCYSRPNPPFNFRRVSP